MKWACSVVSIELPNSYSQRVVFLSFPLPAGCYKKVKAETEAMQEAIQKELQLDPVDKEVVVLYDGERDRPSETWNGKRIVEMQKPRPMWFSKNLTEKSTTANVTATPVKKTDLS